MIKLDCEKFQNALNLLGKIKAKKETKGSENYNITCCNNMVSISKFNDIFECNIDISADITENIKIGIDESTKKIALKLKGLETKIENDTIIVDKKKISFKKLEVLKFKQINNSNNLIERVEVNEEELLRLLEVSYAASTDDVRPVLKGICFNSQDTVALDGFRMSKRVTDSFNIEEPFILPLEAVKFLKQVLSKKSNSEVTIENYKDIVMFKLNNNIGKINIIIEKIQGDYMKYNQIIPCMEDYTDIIEINNLKEFRENVKLIKDIADKKPIVFENINNILNIHTINDKNKLEIETSCGYIKNTNKKIGFNSLYVLESLSIIDEGFKIYYDGFKPAMITKDNKNIEIICQTKIIE